MAKIGEYINKIPLKVRLIVSAVLFSMGFLYPCLFVCSWVFLAPLAFEIFKANIASKRVFGSLFCFFFVFYVCAYSWLVSLYPLDFAGLGNAESIGVIVLGLVAVPSIHATEMSLCIWLFNKFSRKINSRVVTMLAISFGYVLGEFVQGLGPLGFPWARMYVSQTFFVEILQSASVFGSYFITFIVVLVNCFVALAVFNKSVRKKCIAFAAGVFCVNFAFGALNVVLTETNYNKDNEVCAVVLQGNVNSVEKWSGTESSSGRYVRLSQVASEYCDENGIDVDIAVIPETAFPSVALEIENGRIIYSGSVSKVIGGISAVLGCPVVSGTFVMQDGNEYNSMVCYDENSNVLGLYHKVKLVPFGEFVPYRSIIATVFPMLSEINMLSSDLAHGDIVTPCNTGKIKTASLVCFDSVFSESARLQVKNGAQIICVSTNDSWYKTSKALDQHASHSVMRAIENGRPLVRSANTGISMLIEPTGKIVCKSKVNESTFLVDVVHSNEKLTLFTLIGDVTLYLCVLYLFGVVAFNIVKKLRRVN